MELAGFCKKNSVENVQGKLVKYDTVLKLDISEIIFATHLIASKIRIIKKRSELLNAVHDLSKQQ